MHKKRYIYAGPLEEDLWDDRPNYMKINPKLKPWHLTGKRKWCYVCVIEKDPDSGKSKKEVIGPYNKEHAEATMNSYLSEGHCCWIEEDYIR